MQELQQLKKVRLGQDADSEMESNPLSLAIQSDPISPAIRIPKEKFDGTSDPVDHAEAFESRMDFYGASDLFATHSVPTKRKPHHSHGKAPTQIRKEETLAHFVTKSRESDPSELHHLPSNDR